MTNLTPFNNDGLEIVIDTTTGESFASISAVARMTDKPKQYISRYVNGELKWVTKMSLKMAEIQTPIGLRSVTLLNEDQMIEVITKYKPELLAKFAKISLRQFLHKLVGYDQNLAEDDEALLNQILLRRVRKTAKIKSYNDTLGNQAMDTALEHLKELDPTNLVTVQIGALMSNHRLNLEADRSLEGTKCGNIIKKQFRRTQIALEGVETVADHLLTKKELADKQRALENNPSSKEHLLPKVDSKELRESIKKESKKINGDTKLPQLPEGYVIDIALDNIH